MSEDGNKLVSSNRNMGRKNQPGNTNSRKESERQNHPEGEDGEFGSKKLITQEDIDSEDEEAVDKKISKSLKRINKQIERELKNAIEEGKNELELIRLQHEHICTKQENLREQLKMNAGDLLASKLICDQLIELKCYIENIFKVNLDHLKKFEDDENLIVTTFELDQPKLHLFLEILNKMFLFEQKIKAYREVLIQFNKDTIEFGEHKARLLEIFETKVKEYQESIIREADELKRKHQKYEDMKNMSKDIEITVDEIKNILKPDPNAPNENIIIQAIVKPDGTLKGGNIGRFLNLNVLTALTKKKEELGLPKSPKKITIDLIKLPQPGQDGTDGLIKPQPVEGGTEGQAGKEGDANALAVPVDGNVAPSNKSIKSNASGRKLTEHEKLKSTKSIAQPALEVEVPKAEGEKGSEPHNEQEECMSPATPTQKPPVHLQTKLDEATAKGIEELKDLAVITTQDAEITLRELNKSCPETEKLIRWIVSIEQLSMAQRQRFLDLLKYLQEIPIWQNDPIIDYGCIWNFSIEYMTASADSSHIFFGTNDGHLLQWNCQKKKIETDYGVMHSHRIDGLAITPDNCFIYSSSLDGT